MVIATGITEDGGREVLGVVPKDAGEMVAATIRTIFAQPGQSAVRAQVDTVTDTLGSQFPKGKQIQSTTRWSGSIGRAHTRPGRHD